jgi:pantoate kinase
LNDVELLIEEETERLKAEGFESVEDMLQVPSFQNLFKNKKLFKKQLSTIANDYCHLDKEKMHKQFATQIY